MARLAFVPKNPLTSTEKTWSSSRKLAAILLAIVIVVAIDAFWIEPFRIQVSQHRFSMPLGRPIRIAHLSDLHTHGFGRRERDVVARLAESAPDLIVVTGDSIAGDGTWTEVESTLKELRAPLGVWGVEGNWEHWRREAGVHPSQETVLHDLTNANARVRDDLWLVGLDDSLAGAPDVTRAFAGVPAGANVIVLLHSPAGVRVVQGRTRLALAGHTHGGQIRWPWGSPLWLPPGSGQFVEGTYDLGGTTLFVSRGLGNSILDARLFCPPEIAIFDIGP